MKQVILRQKVDKEAEKRYRATREQRKKAAQKAKLRFGALALAAGIGIGAVTPSIIGHMANNANKSHNTQEAIEIALSTQQYIDSIKKDPVMNAVVTEETRVAIENLTTAISTYKQLKHRQYRTLQEEQDYISACKIICESKGLVIDTYTNVIRGKVAEAYNIKDPEEIKDIVVKDFTTGTTPVRFTSIKLPDGTRIVEDNLFSPNSDMDGKLASAVQAARALLDEDYSFTSESIKELPIEKIIKTFEEAKDFEANYRLSVKKNGDVETIKIVKEQEKEEDELEQ